MTPPSAAAAPAIHPRRTVPGRPLSPAPRPRRVSGPARRARSAGSPHSRPAPHAGVALGLLEGLGRLSEHRLLDRLIRGRIWIGLVAFALIGIVTLQLGLLKLNAGIGHTLARETQLQRENAALSIENSELAAGDLVESSAVRLGMEMVPVSSLRFLSTRPGLDASRGAAALTAPVASASSSGGESSSASTAESSGSPSSGEGATERSSESQAPASSGSASEASKAPATESSGAGSGSEPAEQSTPQATPPSGAGEASGGTQAASSGK